MIKYNNEKKESKRYLKKITRYSNTLTSVLLWSNKCVLHILGSKIFVDMLPANATRIITIAYFFVLFYLNLKPGGAKLMNHLAPPEEFLKTMLSIGGFTYN